MRKNFIYAACVAVGFMSVLTGCHKELISENVSEDRVTVNVSVPISETKVVSVSNEAAIHNYQVFLFKEDGMIEDYVNQNTSDITLDCTLGKKTIVVLVNAPSFGYVMDLTTLAAQNSLLTDNEAGSFVMEGKVSVDITSLNSISITVPVTRKVARIELSSLNVAIDMPQYSSKTFTVSSVYLINVSAEMPYFEQAAPILWYNKTAYSSVDDNTLIYDDLGDFEITSETPYTTKNVFYCYPNNVTPDSFSETWSPRLTRLVVEAKLDGETYYYPITVPNIKQNKRYEVNLIITRPGAKSPDYEVDKLVADFKVSVADWGKGATVNEEI